MNFSNTPVCKLKKFLLLNSLILLAFAIFSRIRSHRKSCYSHLCSPIRVRVLQNMAHKMHNHHCNKANRIATATDAKRKRNQGKRKLYWHLHKFNVNLVWWMSYMLYYNYKYSHSNIRTLSVLHLLLKAAFHSLVRSFTVANLYCIFLCRYLLKLAWTPFHSHSISRHHTTPTDSK